MVASASSVLQPTNIYTIHETSSICPFHDASDILLQPKLRIHLVYFLKDKFPPFNDLNNTALARWLMVIPSLFFFSSSFLISISLLIQFHLSMLRISIGIFIKSCNLEFQRNTSYSCKILRAFFKTHSLWLPIYPFTHLRILFVKIKPKMLSNNHFLDLNIAIDKYSLINTINVWKLKTSHRMILNSKKL